MKRITEYKVGKKSLFLYEYVIDSFIVEKRIINVQTDIVTFKNNNHYLLYDSNYKLISDVYNFLNHRGKRLATNTLLAAQTSLRYLYIYAEIINKSPFNFSWEDMLGLGYFLAGLSADSSNYEMRLLSTRNAKSINNSFGVYREFFRYHKCCESIFLYENSIGRYIKIMQPLTKIGADVMEIAKYISPSDFDLIINYIRNNTRNKEIRLRNESMVRLMYEGGCRLGEVLGLTLEDLIINKVDGKDMCFVYIRNRFTDTDYQNAKTCLNIINRSDYGNFAYTTKDVGYQITYISAETYDIIGDYIDIAHERAYKKFRNNYVTSKADAVGDFKTKNEDNFYLMLNNRGQPLSDEGWNKILREIFLAVGLKVDTANRKYNLSHRFRHGFIMKLIYYLKMSREMVMVRSRHKSYSSLDVYYNPTTEQIVKMKTEIEDRILIMNES